MPSPTVQSITACRACDSRDLDPLLDLGSQYLVDFPESPNGVSHPPMPVLLLRCRTCTLVQLRHTVPAKWRYQQYWYRSSVNETMRAELRTVVETAKQYVPIGPHSLVLDIGANDGTLLAQWLDLAPSSRQCPYRIAVEPAHNLYQDVKQHAEQVHQVCWPAIDGIPAHKIHVITSIAMVYGADDLHAFIAKIAEVLAPKGVWVVQFQDLKSGLETTAIDYCVHEHLCWFSAWSFIQTLEVHGLIAIDVQATPINGGSLRLVVGHKGPWQPKASVAKQVMREVDAGLSGLPTMPHSAWPDFLRRVALIRRAVPATIEAVRAQEGMVDLYGASTKASLLLQLCGLTSTQIRQAVERQPQKVGRYVGASGIPIVSEEAWRKDPSPVTLLGIYGFTDAVLQREAEYLRGGGQFLIPIPRPTLLQEAAQIVLPQEKLA